MDLFYTACMTFIVCCWIHEIYDKKKKKKKDYSIVKDN